MDRNTNDDRETSARRDDTDASEPTTFPSFARQVYHEARGDRKRMAAIAMKRLSADPELWRELGPRILETALAVVVHEIDRDERLAVKAAAWSPKQLLPERGAAVMDACAGPARRAVIKSFLDGRAQRGEQEARRRHSR
jgi:hypothetical protein